MANSRKPIPPYVQRGLLGLIIVLMGISVARLLVSMHRQQERIEILEEQVSQLMTDTSRLQIAAYVPQQNYYNRTDYPRHRNDTYYQSNNKHRGESAHREQRDGSYGQPSSTDQTRNDSAATADVRSVPANPTNEKSTSRKFTEVHQFDINTVDSAILVRIPGIAERTAAVILKNRQRYGGFYSPWQLQEFLTWDAAQAYMEEWCNLWFTADANHIRPIHINVATVSEMQRHPYISHEQAIELIRYRTRHKRITSATELNQMQTLSEEQIKQLIPYLAFD